MAKRRYDANKALIAMGTKIRSIRKRRGWTLEDAEEHGWPSWRHLQLIETGKKNISVQTLVNIANLFGIHPSELLKDI